MGMLALIESACGYGMLTLRKDLDDVIKGLVSGQQLESLVKIKLFAHFKSQINAVEDNRKMQSGKVPKLLKKLIKKLNVVKLGDQLATSNNKLGQELHRSLGLSVVCNSQTVKLNKLIMTHFTELTTITEQEQLNMGLALTHGLNRYNLKCNPSKIDTMVVQAQSILEDLDKETNNYVMRCKEMYGWHFPELAKLVENNDYIKFVDKVGERNNCLNMNLSEVLPENLIEPVTRAARTSCGTSLTKDDGMMIKSFCKVIISMTERREQVFNYLKTRMMAIAPNLSTVCGETLGAKLIAHAGTLRNLAKLPSSTIQIIGAEKALFRALKNNDNKTPKFGYMYHASLVQKSKDSVKGPAARLLANGAALCARKDAFDETVQDEGEDPDVTLGCKILGKIRGSLEKRNARSINEGSLPKKRRLDANINSQNTKKPSFNRGGFKGPKKF